MSNELTHCQKCGSSIAAAKATNWIICQGKCPVSSSPFYTAPSKPPRDTLGHTRRELLRTMELQKVRIEGLATNLDEDLTISGCTNVQGLLAALVNLVYQCQKMPGGMGKMVFGLLTEIGERALKAL